ncbi:threonine/serine exporter family protein [Micrococcales bacterium 31B]|nr:threonine/serine exporter family protein [Micrococcales bacterium 31B]
MEAPTGATPLVIHEVFDFAMRIGEVKLANGAGAAEVTATMLAIARSAGISHVDADVTFSTLALSHLPSKLSSPITRMRMVTNRGTNYYLITEADAIAAAFVRNEVRISAAQNRVTQLLRRNLGVANPKIMVGGAMVGIGVAWLFGGDLVVVATAAVAALVMQLLGGLLARAQWPTFFVQVACGVVGPLLAVLVHALDPTVNTSLIVAVSIVALLAGLTTVSAVQDAVGGWYVTAAGRGFEALMLTVGVIGGVSGGIALANALGIFMVTAPYQIPTFSNLAQLAACGAITSAGFVLWCDAPRRSWLVAGALGALCILTYTALGAAGIPTTWANAVAAATSGVLASVASRLLGLAPIVLITPALVPLLPGYMLFRGLSLLAQSDNSGIIILISASSIAISLAAGAVFGQFASAPLVNALPKGATRLNLPSLSQPFSSLRMRRMQRSQRRPLRRRRRDDL